MGKLNPNKIYVNLGEVILNFSYKDFIYFIYNLGMDYYDGLDIISDEDWHDILEALKENYVQYEVEKKIKKRSREFNSTLFLLMYILFMIISFLFSYKTSSPAPSNKLTKFLS